MKAQEAAGNSGVQETFEMLIRRETSRGSRGHFGPFQCRRRSPAALSSVIMKQPQEFITECATQRAHTRVRPCWHVWGCDTS